MSPKAVSHAYMHIPFKDSVFVQQRIQQMSGCLDSELIADVSKCCYIATVMHTSFGDVFCAAEISAFVRVLRFRAD
jgi:hypothetical protein